MARWDPLLRRLHTPTTLGGRLQIFKSGSMVGYLMAPPCPANGSRCLGPLPWSTLSVSSLPAKRADLEIPVSFYPHRVSANVALGGSGPCPRG